MRCRISLTLLMLPYLLLKKALLLSRQPMKRCDLASCETDKGIPGAERVVEERERMVLGKGGEP